MQPFKQVLETALSRFYDTSIDSEVKYIYVSGYLQAEVDNGTIEEEDFEKWSQEIEKQIGRSVFYPFVTY